MTTGNPPLLFVALDDLATKETETLNKVQQLSSVNGNWGIKVNLDWMLQKGIPRALDILQELDLQKPVFVDLKIWNGKRTMKQVFEDLAGKVGYVNSYVLASKELQQSLVILQGSGTKMLGVTVLTHYDDDYCREWFKRSLRETVQFLAQKALDMGCDGIIQPGTMVDAVTVGIPMVIPGIRPPWFTDDRHSEEVIPQMVVRDKRVIGAVCGSPIMKMEKNAAAVREVGDSIGALKGVLQDLQM